MGVGQPPKLLKKQKAYIIYIIYIIHNLIILITLSTPIFNKIREIYGAIKNDFSNFQKIKKPPYIIYKNLINYTPTKRCNKTELNTER